MTYINLDPEKFEGYLSEVEEGVWISAIKAKKIGNGDFSRLIKDLKQRYKWIKIPTPSIMMVERAIHLGFVMREEYFAEPFNEVGNVLYWRKNEI